MDSEVGNMACSSTTCQPANVDVGKKAERVLELEGEKEGVAGEAEAVSCTQACGRDSRIQGQAEVEKRELEKCRMH